MPCLTLPADHASAVSRDFDATAVLTWWRGRPITHDDFLLHALRLAQQLPRAGAVLNLCDDRAAFALGWVAALLRGLPTALPSDRTDGEIAGAAIDSRAVCLLTDRDRSWNLPAAVGRLQIGFDAKITDARIPATAVPNDQVAAILYTSGSTGKPAASVKYWGSLVSGAHALGRMLGWHENRAARQVIGAIAPQHMFGLETTVMLPLQWGAAIHPARPLLPADLDAALVAGQPQAWLMMTPLHAASYLGAPLDCGARLAASISSTMPLPPETAAGLEALWGVAVHEIYGSTETGMIALRRPAAAAHWQLAEDLTLELAAERATVVGRAGMPAHTLNDRIETISARQFTLLGRDSDIVKIGGKRASLARLNAILNRLPGVLDAIMLLPEDGVRLVALTVVEPGIDVAGIRRQLARQIDPVFLPRPLWLVDRLPRNDNGKLPRQALLDLIARLRTA